MADPAGTTNPAFGRFALIACGVLVYVFLAAAFLYRPDDESARSSRRSSGGPSSTDPSAPATAPTTWAPYPTDPSRGCTPNEAWTAEQTDTWVRAAVLDLPVASGHSSLQVDVAFQSATPGATGPLCQPVTVNVDYWEVYMSSSFFSYTDSDHRELLLDGRTPHDLTTPFTVDGCTGVLVAVYTGSPMTTDELPSSINTQTRQLSLGGTEYAVRHDLDFDRGELIHEGFSSPTRMSRLLTPTC